LLPLRARGCELLLVDGGSTDATVSLAMPLVDKLIESAPGRARQMNAGAQRAAAATLWFLHADSRVPSASDRDIQSAFSGMQFGWGYFPIRLSGDNPLLRVIAWAMNQRTRCTGVVTGDHGLFVSRCLFERVGGFPSIELMEDVAISKKLKKICRPVRLQQALVSSGRRWESQGLLHTVLLMWCLRLLFFVGVSPARLANLYRYEP
jgi:rSAM/selenodomain-associated transferase 2